MAFNKVEQAPDLVAPRNVLVSTYDKTGLSEFVSALAALRSDCRFYATGGTLDVLRSVLGPSARKNLVSVSDYTGQPETAGGLVKTLDWKIYLGLLAESGNARHEADLLRLGAVAFDMVVVNFYPFLEAAADTGAAPEELRQRIDIGGPAMLRAASKNYLRVAPVSDPAQYPALLSEIRFEGGTRLETRRRLSAAAFALTARFDAAVSSRLAGLGSEDIAAAYRISGGSESAG
jgi:phosphoribosylaminoimidazolecarboxamide formyltransferase/IMP cyclohydrolase